MLTFDLLHVMIKVDRLIDDVEVKRTVRSRDIHTAMNTAYLTEQEIAKMKREGKRQGFFEKYFACFCTEIYANTVYGSHQMDEDQNR